MNRFAVCRHQAGLTQLDAAKALGVDHSTVAKWESEDVMPRLSTLLKAAKLYGCKPELLLGLCDEEVPVGADR